MSKPIVVFFNYVYMHAHIILYPITSIVSCYTNIATEYIECATSCKVFLASCIIDYSNMFLLSCKRGTPSN